MIRKVYSKRFILFFISLLASNEYFASQKYFICMDWLPDCLYTRDFHEKAREYNSHKCLQGQCKVYDNQFYNFISSVQTDCYFAYFFFCILENILSGCSGVYCRKKVNRHFGFFYGSEIGLFFTSTYWRYKNKCFTIGFNEVKFNVISALMYITKTIFYVREKYTELHGREKILKYISYSLSCIVGINGFHIIHFKFSKIITFNFLNILKVVTWIFSRNEFLRRFFPVDTYVMESLNILEHDPTSNIRRMELNRIRGKGNDKDVMLCTYRVFNSFRYIELCTICDNDVIYIEKRKFITKVLDFILYLFVPSISFDLTSLLSDK